MAKAHTLVDNFNDNAIDPARWYSVYGSPAPLAERIREVNGRIEIRPAPNVGAFIGMISEDYHDLTGSEARVEVVRALNAVPKALTFLRVRKDSSNLVELATTAQDRLNLTTESVDAARRSGEARGPQHHPVAEATVRSISDVPACVSRAAHPDRPLKAAS